MKLNHTVFESNGIMQKPKGSNGPSSGNILSIGAKTNSEHAPKAFSSTPAYLAKIKSNYRIVNELGPFYLILFYFFQKEQQRN